MSEGGRERGRRGRQGGYGDAEADADHGGGQPLYRRHPAQRVPGVHSFALWVIRMRGGLFFVCTP